MRKSIHTDSEDKANSTAKAMSQNPSPSSEKEKSASATADKSNSEDFGLFGRALELCACFFSLQISYLVWGIMQELIMNTKYQPTPLNPSGMFPSATFCVFSNRFLAIIVAAIICYYKVR
jgi:hypothetical protein